MDTFQGNVTLPDALVATRLPDGWTVVRSGDPLIVMGPESDLQLSFLARPVDDDMASLLRRVWQEVKPGFDLPVLQKVETPAKDGWHGEIVVVYDIPESESRMVFAIIRLLAGRAYITLVDGSRAGFSRRIAQFVAIAAASLPDVGA